MSELKEKIEELKKSRKKLCIVTGVNLIFGISLVILFITSFTKFSIPEFRDIPILLKLFWLAASIINFYAVFKTIPIIKQSKNLKSKIKELQELLHTEGIC